MRSLFPDSTPPPGEIERALKASGLTLLVGVDEAGRGALCGPVAAAAVALPPGARIPGLHDSKLLSPAQREAAAAAVLDVALASGVGMAGAEEIDEKNILNATFLAMRRALAAALPSLPRTPDLVLVDGPHAIRELMLAQKPVVKGDRRSLNIAAASVLAKTRRDRLMAELASAYPGYGLEVHMGYGTKAHLAALASLGPSPIHRRTFLHIS
jgi:ribonuclease HII